MADENNQNNQAHDPNEEKNGNSQNSNAQANEEKKLVPLEALHEERNKRKELQAQLEERERLEKEAKEKELAEQGKYKDLLESTQKERDEYKTKYEEKEKTLTSYEEKVQSRIEEKVKTLEEGDQELVNELLEGKSVFEKDSILSKFISRIQGAKNTNVNNAAGGSNQGTKTEALEGITAKEKELEDAKKSRDSMKVLRIQRELSELKERVKK